MTALGFGHKMLPQQGQHNHLQSMKTSCMAHLFSAESFLVSNLRSYHLVFVTDFFAYHIGEINLDR